MEANADYKLPSLHCTRCHFDWTPREADPPRVCPRCKNTLWNELYKTEKGIPIYKRAMVLACAACRPRYGLHPSLDVRTCRITQVKLERAEKPTTTDRAAIPSAAELATEQTVARPRKARARQLPPGYTAITPEGEKPL